MTLKGKTVVITGGSRGIGKAIALQLAAEGANISIGAKTTEPHPKLEGTIHTAAEEIRAAGASGVCATPTDIRDELQIANLVSETIAAFGSIDILVNNASAIDLSPTENINSKKLDLMHQVNVRGTLLMSQAAIPYLKKSANPHILTLSPPINLSAKWFGKHLPYTLSKYGMSMIVLGLAEELKKYGIGVNALWPKTTIATAAVKNLLGGEKLMQKSRKPAIVADAASIIFSRSSKTCTGNFFIDEDVLRENGTQQFDEYSVNPGEELFPDLFID